MFQDLSKYHHEKSVLLQNIRTLKGTSHASTSASTRPKTHLLSTGRVSELGLSSTMEVNYRDFMVILWWFCGIYMDLWWFYGTQWVFTVIHRNFTNKQVLNVAYLREIPAGWCSHFHGWVKEIPARILLAQPWVVVPIPKNTPSIWGLPSDVCWFINPHNYSYLRTINHSDWSYLHQLSYLGGPTL